MNCADLCSCYHPVEIKGLPRFYGGAVGYIGYDMVRFFEQLPDATRDDPGWNDACMMITDTLLIFDNLQHTMKVVCNVHVDENRDIQAAYQSAVATIEQVIALLRKPVRENKAARFGPARARSVLMFIRMILNAS